MPYIDQNFIDELQNSADIVDVVSRRVSLKKSGSNYQACCPFHQEKTPSFSVSPSKQLFKCFGCGVGGGVLKFIQEYDHLDFVASIEALASEMNTPIIYEQKNIQNKMLKLTNIDDIPKLYKNINSSNQLFLSTNIKFKQFAIWDIIQFICSWKKKHPKNTEILLHKLINVENINKEDEILLTAFFSADKVIYKDEDKRMELLQSFIPYVESMNSSQYNSESGKKIKFLFFGGATNEFLKSFYNGKIFKHRQEVVPFIKTLLWNAHFKTDDKITQIAEIIYELIHNTDKHARLDLDNNYIKRSVRALSIDFIEFSNKDKDGFLNKYEHYRGFLSDVKKVLSISVFDNGEGIIKKYNDTLYKIGKKDKKTEYLDDAEKLEILKEAFKHGTTSSTIPNSGMGLFYVQEKIKEIKGSLSIKTNSLDFFMSPNLKKIDAMSSDEYHTIITGNNSAYTGTSITLLIPLDK